MNLFIFFRSISNLFIKILQQFGFYPFYIFPKHLEGYILQFFIFLEKNTNRGSETSAPVEDGFGEMGGVYVPSFRARYSARHSQQRECVAFERGARGSGLEQKDLCEWQTIVCFEIER